VHRPGLQLIILADAPEALTELCGITLLERLLRMAQRIGFERASILSTTPEAIRGELARPSWARAHLLPDVMERVATGPIAAEEIVRLLQPEANRTLLIPGGIYCDSRLLTALADCNSNAILIDSVPPDEVRELTAGFPPIKSGRFSGAVSISTDFMRALSPSRPLVDEVRRAWDNGAVEAVDAATQPSYIVGMRRHLRPIFFAAPSPNQNKHAEKLILNTAQNGTLDLPALAHAPLEDRLISFLCRTPITPNQITLAGFALGLVTTVAFARGHLLLGAIVALIFGVVDGLDGKQARVKVETTPRGEWEHRFDLVLEYSWWSALACHFRVTSQLPYAFWWLALLIGADLVDREARRRARIKTGRLLDDVSPFDRLFRLVGARRNINIWILTIGPLLGDPARAYLAICLWTGMSAIVHGIRALAIERRAGLISSA
jgi:phosphatidylglycerophosphate synthase